MKKLLPRACLYLSLTIAATSASSHEDPSTLGQGQDWRLMVNFFNGVTQGSNNGHPEIESFPVASLDACEKLAEVILRQLEVRNDPSVLCMNTQTGAARTLKKSRK